MTIEASTISNNHRHRRKQGSISSTYVRRSKSIKFLSSCHYHFTLLGSMRVKAVCRTLMKLSPLTTLYKKIKLTFQTSYFYHLGLCIVLTKSVTPPPPLKSL